MRAVPMDAFKSNISEYVTAAGDGEEIVIMHEGQPLARLMPPEDMKDRFERQRLALDRMLARREQLRAEGVRVSAAEIREWIDEGRP